MHTGIRLILVEGLLVVIALVLPPTVGTGKGVIIAGWLVAALLVAAIIWTARRDRVRESPAKGEAMTEEGKKDESIHVHTEHQSGGIAAGIINFTEVAPGVKHMRLTANEERHDRIVNSFAVDLVGRPAELRAEIRGEHVDRIEILEDATVSMLKVGRGTTNDGHPFVTVDNPHPGRYIVNIFSTEPESGLDVRTGAS